MALTTAQLQTWKADILADPTALALFNAGDNSGLINYYNGVPATDFWVFKTFVDNMQIKEEGLDWVEHEGLSSSKFSTFQFMINGGGFNPSIINIRNGIANIFAGPQQVNTRGQILNISVRLANHIEAILAVSATGPAGGNGSASTSSALLTFQGNVTIQDARDVRNV